MAQERITVDPNRMHGLPSIRDTRVTVSEDVLAALEYAAAAAQERELAVVAPAV